MPGIGDIAGGLRRSEGGYTLIELLVAATMGMVVMGGAVMVFIGAVRSEPRTSSQVAAIQQGRVVAERITRELRQGLEVVPAGASGLELVTYLPGGSCASSPGIEAEPCSVTYACGDGVCTRTVAQPDGSSPGAAAQAVSGLASDEVFTYSPPIEAAVEPDPEYVGVEFAFAMQEGGPVVVADGATLRNGGS
jgi:type II secretory pathway pseudopilin PulG